jgi:hypothetical protein
MTAEVGTVSTFPLLGAASSMSAYIAGLSRPPGLASSSRTVTVRVCAFRVG